MKTKNNLYDFPPKANCFKHKFNEWGVCVKCGYIINWKGEQLKNLEKK